ncbi:hypothetical protein [Actinopolymorpha pittospori]|uniref:Uncharacterized protein n=1 Tax=Actinopolymorpha pittospori TaxID=648752 RepID=A0A927R7F2_9ACTN|nr:hypothetical protein [Actinopolymorpha pittospori]MBE1604174.1 hypothetical protein [Actinopolymorpha pittospori]
MKPGNGNGSCNHSNNYDPGVKVGNEVPRSSDALPQPGQIEALKRPDPA